MFGVVVVENVWLVSAVAEERVGAVKGLEEHCLKTLMCRMWRKDDDDSDEEDDEATSQGWLKDPP